jgi:O-acetylhomoserine/O-acetylserine sulfhydrylase-like pyridoxal-dependent enzyme
LHETFGNIAFVIAARVLGLRDLGPSIAPLRQGWKNDFQSSMNVKLIRSGVRR